MNLPPHPVDGSEALAAGQPAAVAADRRLIDDIFGDVLPDTTADERDAGQSGSGGTGSHSAGSDSEQWYRENRPPHHGD